MVPLECTPRVWKGPRDWLWHRAPRLVNPALLVAPKLYLMLWNDPVKKWSRIFSIFWYAQNGLFVRNNTLRAILFLGTSDPCDLEGRNFSIFCYAKTGFSVLKTTYLFCFLSPDPLQKPESSAIKHKTAISKMLLAPESVRRLVIILNQCNRLFVRGIWTATERLSKFVLHRLTR